MLSVMMTLSDLLFRFSTFFWKSSISKTMQDRVIFSIYCWTLIGSHMWSIKWRHVQWPLTRVSNFQGHSTL